MILTPIRRKAGRGCGRLFAYSQGLTFAPDYGMIALIDNKKDRGDGVESPQIQARRCSRHARDLERGRRSGRRVPAGRIIERRNRSEIFRRTEPHSRRGRRGGSTRPLHPASKQRRPLRPHRKRQLRGRLVGARKAPRRSAGLRLAPKRQNAGLPHPAIQRGSGKQHPRPASLRENRFQAARNDSERIPDEERKVCEYLPVYLRAVKRKQSMSPRSRRGGCFYYDLSTCFIVTLVFKLQTRYRNYVRFLQLSTCGIAYKTVSYAVHV